MKPFALSQRAGSGGLERARGQIHGGVAIERGDVIRPAILVERREEKAPRYQAPAW